MLKGKRQRFQRIKRIQNPESGLFRFKVGEAFPIAIRKAIGFPIAIGRLLAVGYWLLAVGYWQLAIGYWQLAIGSWLLAIGFWLLAFGFWLLAIGYWLLAIGYWLLAIGS